MENWKTIEEFPNYEVSDQGNVRNRKSQKKLKFKNDQGYSAVGLYLNKKQYTKKVHRLVAEAFIDKIECGNLVESMLENKTEDEKQNRYKEQSEIMSKKYGHEIVIDGQTFNSVRSAARYIKDMEPDRGSYETIRKEIKRVSNGTRPKFKMYGKYSIGY